MDFVSRFSIYNKSNTDIRGEPFYDRLIFNIRDAHLSRDMCSR